MSPVVNVPTAPSVDIDPVAYADAVWELRHTCTRLAMPLLANGVHNDTVRALLVQVANAGLHDATVDRA